MISANIKTKKRMLYILIIAGLIFLGLTIRIAYLQLIKGNELKLGAYEQQTLDRKINPKRGTIYDSTGKNVLATSATVETVTIYSLLHKITSLRIIPLYPTLGEKSILRAIL